MARSSGYLQLLGKPRDHDSGWASPSLMLRKGLDFKALEICF